MVLSSVMIVVVMTTHKQQKENKVGARTLHWMDGKCYFHVENCRCQSIMRDLKFPLNLFVIH